MQEVSLGMHHALDSLFTVKKTMQNVDNWLFSPSYQHSCRSPFRKNKKQRKMACCNCMKLHEHPWLSDGYW